MLFDLKANAMNMSQKYTCTWIGKGRGISDSIYTWILRIIQSTILHGVKNSIVVSAFPAWGRVHLSQHAPYLSADKKLKMTNLKKGLQYEFRVAAVNAAGIGDASEPSQPVFVRDSTSKCTAPHPSGLGIHKAESRLAMLVER